MLLSFEKTAADINDKKLLHIAGTESLLKKLPKGNWIGGSTEYFMTEHGGKVTDGMLFVTEITYEQFSIASYNCHSISNITADAFDNGFSIVILPFDSPIHEEYAHNAPGYKDMFIKNMVGWVAGTNLNKPNQKPITINGLTGEIYEDQAVVLHIAVPDEMTVSLSIVNIFEPDMDAHVIEFDTDSFSVTACRIDGEEIPFADYIKKNNIDTKFPLVGSYSGADVNTSFKKIENDTVYFYAPVFSGIKYRMAKPIHDYVHAFSKHLTNLPHSNVVFSCNCILNFLYGELEGKDIKHFYGPITFGEVAYQLVNQTLAYVVVE